jgi:hypothetical protein
MATILIQGSSEETRKTVETLHGTFNVVNKKVSYTNENGLTSVYEVSSDMFTCGEHTEEEVLKALYCCTYIDRKCNECPYRKVLDCQHQVLTDGAVVVGRMHERASRSQGGAKNED